MTSELHLNVERIGFVGVITLNRPDRGNAFLPEMGHQLTDCLSQLDEDSNIRSIVITGAGKAFCVGADLNRGNDTFKDTEEEPASAVEVMNRFRARKPVVAAINGAAVGIGLSIALYCDFRIVANNAKLGFPFVRRGVIPESGSHWLLQRLVGSAIAADLLLTGRIIDGTEAVSMGLAKKATNSENVLLDSMALAQEIATLCSPTAVRESKEVLWRAITSDSLEQSVEREIQIFEDLLARPDALEGVRSFLERRDPVWSPDDIATSRVSEIRE